MVWQSEFAGWAAEMFSGDHAVVKTGDMSFLAFSFINDEITDARPFHGFRSSVCWFLHEGHYCSHSRMSVAPFWVVFSVAFERSRCLPRLLFPCVFQYLLAAMLAAMLMESFCFLFSGFERVRVFKFLLFLDPGFFEHVAHVWKGKLAKDESEENVFLLSSGAPSCRILAGFFPRAWRARVLEGETLVHH